jgi:UDP-galactopyranose mutase
MVSREALSKSTNQSTSARWHWLTRRKVLPQRCIKRVFSYLTCKIINGYTEEGVKVRVSKLSNSLIERPVALTYEQRNKNKVDGMKETAANKVLEVTYKGEDFALIKA